jgi:predicted AlkP superfamily pyrophosphatase or phosphodiesterase
MINNTLNMKKLSLSAILMALFLSCAKPESHEVEHVFYIGLDGWGSYSVEQSDMQNVKKMMAEGAWTLKKRTVLPSHSATNWDAMFTGVGPEQHGFWECCSEKPDLEPAVKNAEGIFPTVFTYLREKEPKAEIGCLYEWSGIKYLIDTVAFSYHAKVAQAELCEAGRQYILEKKPRFAAFIYDDPDHVGHSVGHDTPELYKKLKELDLWIGQIVDAIDEAGILDKSVIVITSDHGGIDKGHGGITMAEMRTPLIIWGKGVKKGWCFDDVPTVQQDVASVLADLLGVKLPDYCRGRSIGGIFE